MNNDMIAKERTHPRIVMNEKENMAAIIFIFRNIPTSSYI